MGSALNTFDPIGDAAREIVALASGTGGQGLGYVDRTHDMQTAEVAEVIRKHLNRPPEFKLEADREHFELHAKHWAVFEIAKSLQHTLDQLGGKNSVMLDLNGPKGPLCVTVHYKHGKSPGETIGELIGMLRGLLDKGLAPAEQEAAIDRACKWLYDYDVLAPEKEANAAAYREIDQKMRRKARRWWPDLFKRRK